MTETYWIAVLRSVARESRDLIVRLEGIGRLDPEKTVTELRLKECAVTQEDFALLETWIFEEVDLYFQEEGAEKYLEIGLDSPEANELRLEYVECERQETSYTFDELTVTLKHVTQHYESQIKKCREESNRLHKIQDRLEQEIGKEVDRLERKKEFFANTERAAHFDERLQCYLKVLNWIEMFKRD
jgi:hypothetical protein